jgi:hypothetical protein
VGWEPDLSTHPDEWLEAASPEPFVLPSMAKELSKPDAQSEALNNQTLSSSVPPANSSPVEASEPVIRLRGEKIKLNDRPEMVHSSLAASIFNYQSVSSGFLPLEHSRLRNGPKPVRLVDFSIDFPNISANVILQTHRIWHLWYLAWPSSHLPSSPLQFGRIGHLSCLDLRC